MQATTTVYTTGKRKWGGEEIRTRRLLLDPNSKSVHQTDATAMDTYFIFHFFDGHHMLGTYFYYVYVPRSRPAAAFPFTTLCQLRRAITIHLGDLEKAVSLSAGC